MVDKPQRPFRFGVIASGVTARNLIEAARVAEHSGFSSIALNDHFNSTVAPLGHAIGASGIS